MFFWETITKSLSALQGSDWLRLFSRRLVSNPGQESKDLTAEWAKVSQGSASGSERIWPECNNSLVRQFERDSVAASPWHEWAIP